MVILETDRLILRDLETKDIETRIRWENIDNEWQAWDAPWEYEYSCEIERQDSVRAYIDGLYRRCDIYATYDKEHLRRCFELVIKDTNEYIGWINSYNIDSDYSYTDGDGLLTIGVDIPELSARGKGYSFEALMAVIDYFRLKGFDTIYTQTWSGNVRMINLAKKLGFEVIKVKKDLRKVRGESYDGLTFILKLH